MIRTLKFLALLIPILVPPLMAAGIVYERHTAPIYRIRIEGYDPRDMLYGHYLRFRFAPEQSANSESFPDDIGKRLKVFDGRYYIPEDKADLLDQLLRDEARVVELDIGLPNHGSAFMGDLYIDGTPMNEALRDFEDGVDFNGEVRGQ